MSWWEKVVRLAIRPPRAIYELNDLPGPRFTVNGRLFMRHDIQVRLYSEPSLSGVLRAPQAWVGKGVGVGHVRVDTVRACARRLSRFCTPARRLRCTASPTASSTTPALCGAPSP